MRREATKEEWYMLYQVAAKIKELKPWERFWDMDLISIQEEDEEDAAFISILGKGGDCYGIVVYEGFEGLNDYLMLTMQDRMNLSVEYAMYSQNNLTCYWGNREELSEKQRKIIKDIGCKFRGRNQWLYFMSFMEGYYPYNLNQDEVKRMTHYFEQLVKALEYYERNELDIDFESGNMYCFAYDQQEGKWIGSEKPLPFMGYQFPGLILDDEELMEDLRKVKGSKHVLEVDIAYLGAGVNDKEYERPGHPRLCLISEANTGMILKADMAGPEEDVGGMLAEGIIGFIFSYGAPKEIRVSNVIVEAFIDQICELAGIKIRKVKRLPALDKFMEGMRRMHGHT